MQLLEVNWDDITTEHNWVNIDEDCTDGTIHCKTVGWQVKSNRKVLIIASSITSHGKCAERTIIPRSVITGIRKLPSNTTGKL